MELTKNKFEEKNFEFRFYLLGDLSVGKRSIINRFRMLNCTKTITLGNDDFIKIFQISEYTILMKFEIIINPELTIFKEESDEIEEKLTERINYKDFIIRIQDLKSQGKNSYFKDRIVNINHCFLFCFDLSNFDSIKPLQTFYDELKLNFAEITNDVQILIGNKLDKKAILKETDVVSIEHFLGKEKQTIQQNKALRKSNSAMNLNSNDVRDKTLYEYSYQMLYYEISTKNFFNFERFFNRFFFENIENVDIFFSSLYFKKNFDNLLNLKSKYINKINIAFRNPKELALNSTTYLDHKHTMSIFITSLIKVKYFLFRRF